MTIAIAGRVPTLDEATDFAADPAADKRVRLVNRLIDSTDYADNFATKWAAILRNKRSNDADKRSTYAFYNWIRDSLHENLPYDQFVREIITASGDVSLNPPVAWYRELREQSALVEDTAQLFLGMRIQCRPLPPSSVREMESARLPQLLGLLLADRPQADRLAEPRSDLSPARSGRRPPTPRRANSWSPLVWTASRKRSRRWTTPATSWPTG